MAPKRLKSGTGPAYRRHFCNQPFQRFTEIADAGRGRRALALCGSRRYISPAFPDKACGGVRNRSRVILSENFRGHARRARADSGLKQQDLRVQ
jgi:hypothetical protein